MGVLELRTSLQSLLSGASQNQLFIDQLKLRNGDGDIVLRQAKKTADINDGV